MIKILRNLVSLIFVFGFSYSSFGFNVSTSGTGNWSSTGTWSNSTVPSNSSCPDTIFIDHDITVTASVDLTACGPVVMIINDTLTFQTGKKLYLPAGSALIVNSGGSVIPGGGGGSSNIIEIGGTVVWSTATGTLTPGTVLDIELSDFYASIVNEKIELYWVTASETNNDFFNIEHSITGENFVSLNIINGRGTSTIEKHYQFEHKTPNFGINYYRLKQTDFDGKFSYGPIISVNFNMDDNKELFPNPSHLSFQIATSYSKLVEVYNIQGKKVIELTNYYRGQNISITELDKGIYFVKYFSKHIQKTKKLIVQ